MDRFCKAARVGPRRSRQNVTTRKTEAAEVRRPCIPGAAWFDGVALPEEVPMSWEAPMSVKEPEVTGVLQSFNDKRLARNPVGCDLRNRSGRIVSPLLHRVTEGLMVYLGHLDT